MITPTRLTPSLFWARVANGQMAAVPSAVMKTRRRIGPCLRKLREQRPNYSVRFPRGERKQSTKWGGETLSLPMFASGRGCVKTLTLDLRVELPSQFRRCGSQLHWQQLSEEGN